MTRIVCFISDFGLDDTWVGVCHAAVAKVCPETRVVDLSHGINAYDIRAAAVVAAAGVFQLPDAIHMVVVDPGVGGTRRALCVVTGGGSFLLGPDNGVLLPAALRSGGVARAFELRTVDAHPTFHARDVFAPAAGHLSCGKSPEELGVEIDAESLTAGPFALGEFRDGYVFGEVLGADRFGSLRLSIPSDCLDDYGLESAAIEVSLGHNTLSVPVGRTFTDVAEGDPVVIADSSGWLTLAVNQGSAADRYGVSPGTRVRLRPSG